jgi:dihydrofolate reductase
MASLIYINNISVDGYIEDEHGSLDWTDRRDEVFATITGLIQGVGTHLYGRRLYEAMAVWETDPALAAASPEAATFAAAWQAADKVVWSTTLAEPGTERTRIERAFDPQQVAELKAAATADLYIGGADLAAQALAAGLVDECHLFVHPISIGRGKPALPTDRRVPLDLLDARRLDGAVAHLRYGRPTAS